MISIVNIRNILASLVIPVAICIIVLSSVDANTSKDEHAAEYMLSTGETCADTGYKVRGYNDRVYSIARDKDGYLYYIISTHPNSIDNLQKVLDSDGNHTKDISIFKDKLV